MELKEVGKKKTQYWAHRYTDDLEDGEDISNLIQAGNVNANSYVYPGDYNYIVEYGKKHDETHYLDHGCWVVVSSTGKLWVLDDADYRARFEEKR